MSDADANVGPKPPRKKETASGNLDDIEYGDHVKEVKALRQNLDAQLQRLKGLPNSRETSISITNLQQSIMWLGMELKRLGEANPYPNSYDPTNAKIEPTADNLKL